MTANDGTAVYGMDFSSNRGRTANVNFNEGDTAVTTTYMIIADADVEDIESFTLRLTLRGTTAAGSIAGVYSSIGSPSIVTVFIIDCSCKQKMYLYSYTHSSCIQEVISTLHIIMYFFLCEYIFRE